MTWTNVKWIYLREIRDQLRDRRTLFTIFVLPILLYPLLGMGFLQMAQFRREYPTPILVLGVDALPASPRLIHEGKFEAAYCPPDEGKLIQLEIQPGSSVADEKVVKEYADRRMRSGKYDAVIYFPPDFATELNRSRSSPDGGSAAGVKSPKPDGPQPAIFVDTASDKSRIARDRVERVLYRWRQSVVQDNLKHNNLPAAAAEPFQVVNKDVAREQSRRAAVWSKILPFVVLVWALTGAFYPAVDLCAGEKERGTLETLLCSPAERVEIVWGKLLTIMTFSIATSVLNLMSMGFTGTFVLEQLQQADTNAKALALGAPPISAIAWLLLALVPLSALFSALSLAVAAFARSSREGQYYLMPLFLITLPLMMLPMLPNSQLDLGTSFIPVSGVMLLLRSLIEGQYWESMRFVVPVLVITTVCCWLAVRWAVDQFNNESVLFRESERWGLGLWLRQVVRDRGQTPTVAEAVLCGVLLLVIRFFTSFVVGMPANWTAFATSTVVTLIAFFAAPALIMTVMLTRNPRKTLLLNLPSPAALGMAMLLAFALHPVGLAFGKLVRSLYPLSSDAMTQIQAYGNLINDAPSIWLVLLVMALTPAVCEELAFRGFILSGMRHTGHKWGAILGSAVLFGAAHGLLQQSVSAAVLGIVLGYLAIQTGSLLTTIAFHFLYNAGTMLMMLALSKADLQGVLGLIYRKSSEGDGVEYHPYLIVVSAVVSAAILLWFRRLPCEPTTEEQLQSALDREWVPAAGFAGAGYDSSLCRSRHAPP
jgi:sodium transport system permease protein